MNKTTETKMTTQTGFAFAPGFAVEPGCTVEWKNEAWIVVSIYDKHGNGRIPVLAVSTKDGREGLPFVDEIKVTRPAVRRHVENEISQETAERFADWNRRGNGR